MKKSFFLLCALLFSLSTTANESNYKLDSLSNVVNEIKETQAALSTYPPQVDRLESVVADIQKTLSKLASTDASLRNELMNINREVVKLDSLVNSNAENLIVKSNELNQNIQNVSDNASSATNKLTSNLLVTIIVGSVVALLILLVSLLLFLLLKKKTTSSYDKIREAQNALQEESIKLDAKLVELLEKQMSVQEPVTDKKTETDHSLALKVADEIVRIETNLSRMDNTIKGYKQLSASVRRIKDNFLSNGYEMVDLLGKPYKEGIKAIVTFETDESLQNGEQIISRIIKPQINYNGVMIQTAQIVVSQNLD